MIIAISGLSGSGKNTLGSLLAKKLGYRLVCPTFKDLAKAEGMGLLDFQKKAEKDQDIDRKFDMHLKKEAEKGDCVVTTWLGPWMVEPDLSVWVFASGQVRASRLAGRDGMGHDEALLHIQERDNGNRQRYMDVYGIDINDLSGFDMCLNSGIYAPGQLLEMVIKLIEINDKK